MQEHVQSPVTQTADYPVEMQSKVTKLTLHTIGIPGMTERIDTFMNHQITRMRPNFHILNLKDFMQCVVLPLHCRH
jgi:hypothetical protein